VTAAWLAREFAATAGNTQVGCGLITWSLARAPHLLAEVLRRAPTAVMLSFGSPVPFAPAIKQSGTPFICQVQTQGAIIVESVGWAKRGRGVAIWWVDNPRVPTRAHVGKRSVWHARIKSTGRDGDPRAALCPTYALKADLQRPMAFAICGT
jgi:hypothetical protein